MFHVFLSVHKVNTAQSSRSSLGNHNWLAILISSGNPTGKAPAVFALKARAAKNRGLEARKSRRFMT
jgi:hypothetical protein